MASKAELAVEIFRANPGMSNTDFVSKLIADVGMTKLGARTYSYNVRKMFASGEPIVKAPKTPKEPKACKEPKAPKTAKTPKLTKAVGSLAVDVVDSEVVTAAKAIHRASYLSFMEWANLSQASRDEFVAQVPVKSDSVSEVIEAETASEWDSEAA